MRLKKLTKSQLLKLSEINPKFYNFYIKQEELKEARNLNEKLDLVLDKENETRVETTFSPEIIIENKESEKESLSDKIRDSLRDSIRDSLRDSLKEDILGVIIPLITEEKEEEDLESMVKEILSDILPDNNSKPSEEELLEIINPLIKRLELSLPHSNEKELTDSILDKINSIDVPKSITELDDVPDKIQAGYSLVGSKDGKSLIFKKIGTKDSKQISGGGKLTIKDEGTIVNEHVRSINFVGDSVTATGDRDITVTVDGSVADFWTIELIDTLTVDFYAPYNMTLDSIDNVLNVPVISLFDDDISYTLGDPISIGSKITVTADIASVININQTIS